MGFVWLHARSFQVSLDQYLFFFPFFVVKSTCKIWSRLLLLLYLWFAVELHGRSVRLLSRCLGPFYYFVVRVLLLFLPLFFVDGPRSMLTVGMSLCCCSCRTLAPVCNDAAIFLRRSIRLLRCVASLSQLSPSSCVCMSSCLTFSSFSWSVPFSLCVCLFFQLRAPILFTRTAACCYTYLWSPTSTGAAGAAVSKELFVASFVATLSRSSLLSWIVERLDCRGVFTLLNCHLFSPCSDFFAFSLYCCTVGCTWHCAFNLSASTRTAVVVVPMSINEGWFVCTYDL